MSQSQSEARATPHVGGCHCGAVRFEVDLDLTAPVGRCNCSICQKRSATGAIVKPAAFRVLAGGDDVGFYAMRAGGAGYSFCKRCGIQVFGSGDIPELGGAFVSVNVNCLDGVDPSTLDVIYWDGRHDNWHAGPRNTPWPVNA
ncbi:MAG TPA: GFA family protein [Polyangia bacterium]|nr:GFA family protein [Polyangia bacterium]